MRIPCRGAVFLDGGKLQRYPQGIQCGWGSGCNGDVRLFRNWLWATDDSSPTEWLQFRTVHHLWVRSRVWSRRSHWLGGLWSVFCFVVAIAWRRWHVGKGTRPAWRGSRFHDFSHSTVMSDFIRNVMRRGGKQQAFDVCNLLWDGLWGLQRIPWYLTPALNVKFNQSSPSSVSQEATPHPAIVSPAGFIEGSKVAGYPSPKMRSCMNDLTVRRLSQWLAR